MHELGVYLRKNLPDHYIKEKGYDDMLPRKIKDENPAEKDNQGTIFMNMLKIFINCFGKRKLLITSVMKM